MVVGLEERADDREDYDGEDGNDDAVSKSAVEFFDIHVA